MKNITSEKSSLQGYSYSHLQKGADYDDRFSSLPGRKLMWEIEKQLLTDLIPTIPNKHYYLDFATGTGRILAHVAPHCSNPYALDVSMRMLTVAQEKYPSAKFINANFREYPDPLHELQFDLITAFRFFPNAEDGLRDDAMSYISQHLKSGGYLIINNHRVFNSISYRILRCLRRLSNEEGMRHSEILRLADKYSLKVSKTYSLGIWPQTERWTVLPWSLVSVLEKMNYRFSATRHLLGYNMVYIFEK